MSDKINLGQMLAASRELADRGVAAHDAEDATYVKPLGLDLALLAVILITVLYAAFELRWNIQLVEAIGQGADKDRLNELVSAGRWLTAFGLVWVVSKGALIRPAPGPGKAARVLLVAASIIAMHSAISAVFEQIIDAMSPSAVLQAHKASVYRFMHARDHDAIKSPTDAVLVPLLAYSPRGRHLLDAAYEAAPMRATERVDEIMVKMGPKFDEMQAKIDPLQLLQFDQAYKEYIEASQSTERGLRFFRSSAIEKFKAATGGMEPNSKATRIDFAKEVMKSNLIEKRVAARKYVAMQESLTSAVAQIKSIVPHAEIDEAELVKLDRDELRDRLLRAAKRDIMGSLPAEDEVKTNVAGRSGAQAAIIPLAAMVLSLAGVCANIGSALGLLVKSTRLTFPALGLAAFLAAGFAMQGNAYIAQSVGVNPVILHTLKAAVFIEGLFV